MAIPWGKMKKTERVGLRLRYLHWRRRQGKPPHCVAIRWGKMKKTERVGLRQRYLQWRRRQGKPPRRLRRWYR